MFKSRINQLKKICRKHVSSCHSLPPSCDWRCVSCLCPAFLLCPLCLSWTLHPHHQTASSSHTRHCQPEKNSPTTIRTFFHALVIVNLNKTSPTTIRTFFTHSSLSTWKNKQTHNNQDLFYRLVIVNLKKTAPQQSGPFSCTRYCQPGRKKKPPATIRTFLTYSSLSTWRRKKALQQSGTFSSTCHCVTGVTAGLKVALAQWLYAYILRMWLCMKCDDMVHGCMVYTEHT